MADILWLLVFTSMLSIGQLLFKKVGLLMQGLSFADGVQAVLSSPLLYVSLGLYGFATALWIWILSRVPLSLAYPWVGVGVILVPFLAWLVYGERMTTMYWVGAVLVAVGVVLTQYGTVRT